jgi:hypothetical protein
MPALASRSVVPRSRRGGQPRTTPRSVAQLQGASIDGPGRDDREARLAARAPSTAFRFGADVRDHARVHDRVGVAHRRSAPDRKLATDEARRANAAVRAREPRVRVDDRRRCRSLATPRRTGALTCSGGPVRPRRDARLSAFDGAERSAGDRNRARARVQVLVHAPLDVVCPTHALRSTIRRGETLMVPVVVGPQRGHDLDLRREIVESRLETLHPRRRCRVPASQLHTNPCRRGGQGADPPRDQLSPGVAVRRPRSRGDSLDLAAAVPQASRRPPSLAFPGRQSGGGRVSILHGQ